MLNGIKWNLQVFQPTIQRRRIAYAEHKHVVSGILKHLKQHALGRLLNDQGEPNIEVIKKLVFVPLKLCPLHIPSSHLIKYFSLFLPTRQMLIITLYFHRLFDAIDQNKDSHLSASELKALIIGIRFDEIDLDQDDAVDKILKDFDTSHDNLIDIDEFIAAVSKWLNVAKGGRPGSADAGPQTIKVLDDYHEVSCAIMTPFYLYSFLVLSRLTYCKSCAANKATACFVGSGGSE